MDIRDFESTLYGLSIEAIHAISGDTQDPITIQEAIEHNSFCRPILSSVQIWTVDFDKEDNYCEIHFVLSPDFMMENPNITLTGLLHKLNWIFEIQRYDYGEDEEGNKISDEDQIGGWLIKSKIKVNYEEIKINGINLKDFKQAISNVESD
jgi:hypothetical protein